MATENEVKKNGDEIPVKVENVTDGAAPATDGPTKKKKRAYRKKKTTTEGGEAKEAATPAAEGASEEVVNTVNPVQHDNTAKIFVGNLSFETTQQEIEEIFGKAGKIAEINIITRGDRSLGYGFISYETEADADQAVKSLDSSEIGGRKINVERAQDKEPKAVRGRAGRGRGASRGRGGRGGARAGREEGAARVDGEETEESADVKAEGDETKQAAAPRARPARRGRGGSRVPRPARERGGEPSTTTLFVANLPFKVTDEDLLSVFKEYNVLTAHVVTLRSGRSKGFGFVEVANQEEQQKILAELNAIEIDGRELVIKVAMANQTAPAEGDAAPASEAGANAEAQ